MPASCCEDREEVTEVAACQKNPDNADWAGELPGCFTKLKTTIEENQDYILYGCIGIILVLVSAFPFGLFFVTSRAASAFAIERQFCARD